MGRYNRLRALCCRYWSIAPPDFDAMVRRREISIIDVMELVRSLACDPLVGFGLATYLVPELEDRQRNQEQQRKSVNSFGMMLNVMGPKPKTLEEAAFLEKLKKQTAEAGQKLG